MKPLFLDWNLGLGDAIICNGLVRTLAAPMVPYARREIVLPCWERNLPTVRHMFSDLPNVHVVTVEHDGQGVLEPGFGRELLSIGINYHGPINHDQWDKCFYDRAGVPFDAKWSKFFVPSNPQSLVPPVTPYALIHDDPERGFDIDFDRCGELPHYALGTSLCSPLLTDWRDYIRNAAEIHCIDSSVMHLAELLPTTGKLYYHKYARAKGNRQHTDAVFRKPWVVLE
jgi:hypothetical protein